MDIEVWAVVDMPASVKLEGVPRATQLVGELHKAAEHGPHCRYSKGQGVSALPGETGEGNQGFASHHS